MLSNEILQTLKGYTASMKNEVAFVVQTGSHPKRAELIEFLNSFASVSEKISVTETDEKNILRSPISFYLAIDGVNTGVIFSGIPSGHEFSSLVLAVLQASGTPNKLDAGVQNIIRQVQEPLHFEVFVSLSCHNCPDIVQSLNSFALLNKNISTEMIDGGLFQDIITERNIQGVPAVYVNGEVFANGKIDTAQLVNKLIERYPDIKQAAKTNQEKLPLQDITVVGGGPAGVAAAIYAARKGLQVTLVADVLGGQVKDTMGIENLISVPKTTGPKLAGDLQTHMNDYAITIKQHVKVEKIIQDKIKTLELSSGEVIQSKAIIIATGAKWRELGIPGEKENIGNGVAYCPHCDGPFFKGKDVAVVGGGNSGIEAALDLSGIVKSVTVFEFLPDLKADKILVDQAKSRDNIKILSNVACKQVLAENGKVTAIEYQKREDLSMHQQPLAGIFVQIGLLPNSHFVKGLLELTPHGEIKINERGETSAEGIFACGDVTTVPYKQIVIAMGEGAKASLSAFDYLLKNF